MLNLVYKCEDYKFQDGTLTIYDGKVIGMISNLDQFETLAFKSGMVYPAVVCPGLYENENGETVKTVIFENFQ